MLTLTLVRDTLISLVSFTPNISISVNASASVNNQMGFAPIQSVNADARYEHSFTVV